MKYLTTRIKTIILFFVAIVYAGDKSNLHFIPEDSLEYELGYPPSDSTVILTKSGAAFPRVNIKYKNDQEYLKRMKMDYEIHVIDSFIIIGYKRNKEIIYDSLSGSQTSLDSVLEIINKIPNGRYVSKSKEPYEIVIQTKEKYIDCKNCLDCLKGINIAWIQIIFEKLNAIQEKAFNKNR